MRKLDGIYIFGTPATSVIAIGSNDFHIYRLSEALGTLGWNLNPLQFPSGIHLCVTHVHTEPGVADKFLNDVRTELDIIMKDPGVLVEGKVSFKIELEFIQLDIFLYNFFLNFLSNNIKYFIPACHVWNEPRSCR